MIAFLLYIKCLVGDLSYPARPRCTQICVYPRAFITLRVAQFSLKIAHLSFSMGLRGSRVYGLRPRLLLLVVAWENMLLKNADSCLAWLKFNSWMKRTSSRGCCFISKQQSIKQQFGMEMYLTYINKRIHFSKNKQHLQQFHIDNKQGTVVEYMNTWPAAFTSTWELLE